MSFSRCFLGATLVCSVLFASPGSASPVTFVETNCPVPCDASSSERWTPFQNLVDLDACPGTVLFETNLYNGIEDPETQTFFRACTASGAPSPKGDSTGRIARRMKKRQFLSLNTTAPRSQSAQVLSLESSSPPAGDAQAALAAISSYVSSEDASLSKISLFAKNGDAIAGAYVGVQVQKESAASAISTFADQYSGETAAQVCASPEQNRTTSAQVFGVVVATDVTVVQDALRGWNEAECLSNSGQQALSGATIDFISGSQIPVGPPPAANVEERSARLQSRATCSYTQVQPGDGCWAVSQRCGVSTTELENFNGGAGFCNTLQVS